MSTTVEKFNTAEERNTRLQELRARGHRPNKTTDTVPTKWKTVYQLSYAPEGRKRTRK